MLFLGTTRELTAGRQTVALDYEAYREMAERQLAELEAEARRRWPVIECIIVHRLGRVPPTEASVAIAVSTPHRRDAFAAGQWLIDSLKRDVPIWKREQWADGTTEWVHPGMKERETGDEETETATQSPVSPSPVSDLCNEHDRNHQHSRHSSTASAACTPACGSASPTAATSAASTACRTRTSASGRGDEILTFEEITRFVRVVSQMGVHRLRLTGGEPLVRADLPRLVEHAGRRSPASTTSPSPPTASCSPSRPPSYAAPACERLNISLDTLSEETFQKISRREGLDRVLAGIAAAQDAGFEQIRLNAVAIHGLTEDEIVPLARFARERGLELRFIEYMPLDAEQHWQRPTCSTAKRSAASSKPNSARSCPSAARIPASRPPISNTPTAAAASASSTRLATVLRRLRPPAPHRRRPGPQLPVLHRRMGRPRTPPRRRHRRRTRRPRPRLRLRQSPRPRHRHRRLRPPRTRDVPDRRLM